MSRRVSDHCSCSAAIGWTACARRRSSAVTLDRPDGAYLSLLDQFRHGSHGFLDRGLPAAMVQVVQVDHVDTKSSKARLARLAHIGRIGSDLEARGDLVSPHQPELASQQYLVTPPPDGPADQFRLSRHECGSDAAVWEPERLRRPGLLGEEQAGSHDVNEPQNRTRSPMLESSTPGLPRQGRLRRRCASAIAAP